MFVSTENLKVNKIAGTENKGTFALEPLPQGFGATLGNSLRRVLMTAIKGAAVTQVKIAGANHQFTTIEGIKEDVVEITLNLKRLRFKVHGNNPVVATIEKKGKGPVTASDIKLSSDLEIMNKDAVIATVSDDKTTLKMELVIEPGTGYSPMEEREKKNSKLGVIVLDALYSPIMNATYDIEPTRFGERADLDKVILSIETDGSITPEESIKEAAEILKNYYIAVAKLEETEVVSEEDTKKEAKNTKGNAHIMNASVEELPLQTRTINALKKHGIQTLKEMGEMTDEELADIKNLGEKSMSEIKKLLEKENLR